MVWTPIEVILILAIWFPLGLGMVFTPYFLTIFSIMVLGCGSFAAVQAGRATAQAWFGFLTVLFVFVIVAATALVLVGPQNFSP